MANYAYINNNLRQQLSIEYIVNSVRSRQNFITSIQIPLLRYDKYGNQSERNIRESAYINIYTIDSAKKKLISDVGIKNEELQMFVDVMAFVVQYEILNESVKDIKARYLIDVVQELRPQAKFTSNNAQVMFFIYGIAKGYFAADTQDYIVGYRQKLNHYRTAGLAPSSVGSTSRRRQIGPGAIRKALNEINKCQEYYRNSSRIETLGKEAQKNLDQNLYSKCVRYYNKLKSEGGAEQQLIRELSCNKKEEKNDNIFAQLEYANISLSDNKEDVPRLLFISGIRDPEWGRLNSSNWLKERRAAYKNGRINKYSKYWGVYRVASYGIGSKALTSDSTHIVSEINFNLTNRLPYLTSLITEVDKDTGREVTKQKNIVRLLDYYPDNDVQAQFIDRFGQSSGLKTGLITIAGVREFLRGAGNREAAEKFEEWAKSNGYDDHMGVSYNQAGEFLGFKRREFDIDRSCSRLCNRYVIIVRGLPDSGRTGSRAHIGRYRLVDKAGKFLCVEAVKVIGDKLYRNKLNDEEVIADYGISLGDIVSGTVSLDSGKVIKGRNGLRLVAELLARYFDADILDYEECNMSSGYPYDDLMPWKNIDYDAVAEYEESDIS